MPIDQQQNTSWTLELILLRINSRNKISSGVPQSDTIVSTLWLDVANTDHRWPAKQSRFVCSGQNVEDAWHYTMHDPVQIFKHFFNLLVIIMKISLRILLSYRCNFQID